MTIDKQHHEGIITGRSYVINHKFRGRIMIDVVGYFDQLPSETYKNDPHFVYKAKLKHPCIYNGEKISEGSEIIFNIGLLKSKTPFTLVTSKNINELSKSLNK